MTLCLKLPISQDIQKEAFPKMIKEGCVNVAMI